VNVKCPAYPVEVVCWIIGGASLLMYALTRADAIVGRYLDVARAEQEREPDDRLWSESRRRAYRESLRAPAGALLGTVVIPAASLEVPLYGDTSELHLNRGVGLIDRMAAPGTTGNVGIAGHRDGYFRVLQDVKTGDWIEIRLPSKVYRFRISQLNVVSESDTRLLAPTTQPVVTLVTCYPFYFIGSAPYRFIVRGVLESIQETHS
jgi:LPXTG-site transpeptidase (sortase) family protein